MNDYLKIFYTKNTDLKTKKIFIGFFITTLLMMFNGCSNLGTNKKVHTHHKKTTATKKESNSKITTPQYKKDEIMDEPEKTGSTL